MIDRPEVTSFQKVELPVLRLYASIVVPSELLEIILNVARQDEYYTVRVANQEAHFLFFSHRGIKSSINEHMLESIPWGFALPGDKVEVDIICNLEDDNFDSFYSKCKELELATTSI